MVGTAVGGGLLYDATAECYRMRAEDTEGAQRHRQATRGVAKLEGGQPRGQYERRFQGREVTLTHAALQRGRCHPKGSCFAPAAKSVP